MNRPLFEHITRPEKVRLPPRLKAAVLAGAVLVHCFGLYYLFTAKYHYKIFESPSKVQRVELVPPLPSRAPGQADEPVIGAFPGGGQGTSAPAGSGARPSSGERRGAGSHTVSAGGTAPAFSLKVPPSPAPFPSRESQQERTLGDLKQKYLPAPKDLRLDSYTRTDIWGQRPAVASGPDAGESPGGPLGSSYGLARSGSGNKIFYRGKDSLTGRGYDLSPWAQVLVGRIQQNWALPSTDASKAWGKVGITIIVEKTGVLAAVRVVNSPNDQILVRAALEAIQKSRPFPRLPEDFPGARLEAYLLFDYHESK